VANNTFEAAFMTLKNGMTMFFKDGKARELIESIQSALALIKSIPPGGTTDQVLKKASNDDYDVEWGAGGGGSGVVNTWYGTCTTATGTADKVATTVTGDFVLAEGNMAVIRFTYYNNQTEPYLSIDGCTKKRIKDRSGTGNITTALWRDGECITVVYDGTDFIVVEGGTASTSYYGVTKLSNSYMSTSQSLAATSQAVKSVYDIASAAYSPSNPPPTPSPSDATPQDLGTAGAGSSTDYSRADHIHNKPTYSKSDVGLGNVDNVQQYSSTNPPPYPVTSVNGSTGAVTVPTIAVQDTTPTGGELVWVDTDEPGTTTSLPEIDDSSVSAVDTWSSQKIRDFIYPVGSIYMSVNNTSPATIFGGTWEQIKDTFLLSAGDTYTAGATGGEATHTLTTDEMPSHIHSIHDVGAAGTGTAIYGGVRLNQVYANNNSGSTGGGQAHNNMPPYLVVYVWKRTA